MVEVVIDCHLHQVGPTHIAQVKLQLTIMQYVVPVLCERLSIIHPEQPYAIRHQ